MIILIARNKKHQQVFTTETIANCLRNDGKHQRK